MTPHMRLLGSALAVATLATSLLASSASAHAADVLVARMSGAQEVPGPGDEDGRGRAGVHISPRARRLCFVIRVRDIALPATAAHVHAGVAGVAGPPVVTLEPPDESGFSAGCVAVDEKALLRDIRRHPRRYYVNVHNAEFEGGAIRGQLHRFDADRGTGAG